MVSSRIAYLIPACPPTKTAKNNTIFKNTFIFFIVSDLIIHRINQPTFLCAAHFPDLSILLLYINFRKRMT